MASYLLTRYGGIGDVTPITVVAKHLKKQGHNVTLATRSDEAGNQCEMFLGDKNFDAVVPLVQCGPNATRCIPFKEGMADVRLCYPMFDRVVDYMNVLENNSTCIIKPKDWWERSRNSNYVNWTDLYLSWAGIDPTSVEDKTPEMVVLEEEEDQANKFKSKYSHLFMVQCIASSKSRTWYSHDKLHTSILKQYPKAVVMTWKGKDWVCNTKDGEFIFKSGGSKLRASMAMIKVADLYIGADSGFAAVAEAVGTKSLVMFSTVPSWTRMGYYKNCTPIDVDSKYHTFSLGLGDPLRIEECKESLSPREKRILELRDKDVTIEFAASEMNTDVDGLDLESDSIQRKFAASERQQSIALTGVTVEMVMNKIKEIVK